MTLLDYLKTTGETVSAFAGRINEAENTIKKIAYRQRQPSLVLAVKISEATGGEVTEADMVLTAEEQARAA
jgi:putative transcriptional regulator